MNVVQNSTVHTITVWSLRATDLLKANSFAQPNFQTDDFAQRNWPKMPWKHVIKKKIMLSNCSKVIKKVFFSCFLFKSFFKKNAQILKINCAAIGCGKVILLQKIVGKLLTKSRAIFCLCLKFQHDPCILVHLSSSFLHYPTFSEFLIFLGVQKVTRHTHNACRKVAGK